MFWKKKEKYHAPHITDDTFNEQIAKTDMPVLLDFYAGWCPPCKVLSPFIDELAQEYESRALVAKVDTEANPQLSAYFKIKSLPTLVFIQNNKMVERFHGLIPKPNLAELLDAYIAEPEVALQQSDEEE